MSKMIKVMAAVIFGARLPIDRPHLTKLESLGASPEILDLLDDQDLWGSTEPIGQVGPYSLLIPNSGHGYIYIAIEYWVWEDARGEGLDESFSFKLPSQRKVNDFKTWLANNGFVESYKRYLTVIEQ